MVAVGAGEALARVVMMGESDPPITASLGPIDRLICRLKYLEGSELTLPVGLGVNQIRKLREHLERFRKPLKNLSEMEETSFRAKWWMKEVRELCYDTEDYLVQSGAGVHRTLGRIVRFIISWIYSKVKWRTRVSRFMARAEVLKKTCETIIDAEIKAAISLEKRIEAVISLSREMEAVMETRTAQLFDMLSFEDDKQPQLKVVIISGLAGSGKTTLARTLYVKCKRRFRCSAFIRFSRNPDFRSLLTSILSQIKAPSPHGICDVQGLICSISDHLRGKRYFIVIDDVWSPSVWDIISRAFPAGNFRSRIIVTTRSEQVEVAYSGYMLKSAIFKMGATDDGCTHTSTKEKSKVLNIRYNNLPLHLKTCLLYLGMHPEGCTIRKDDLVKQWVAEVFIPAVKTEETSQIPENKEEAILEISQYETEEIAEVPQDGISEILQDQPEQIAQVNQDQREEIAGGYFDELVTRGMLQPVDINHNGEILSCTVHHLVLDLIRYKSKEDNFLIVVDNLESTLGHPDIVRRLSVQFGCEKGASIPESIILSQVRSLTFYGFLGCVPSFVDYGLLRVLNLHIWADEDKIFDLTRIGELYYLRYLKIECNITVRLPLKIQRLQHLGTLELHAQVVSIPSDIGHLKKLLHVRCPCKADVWDLSELTNLLDLQLTCYAVENLEDNMKCIQSVLEKLSSLRSLVLVPASGACSVNTLPVIPLRMCIVSPTPAHLQRLELSRRCCIFSTLPEWIEELHELCVLKIAVRELLREDIDILKGLPALTTLSLHLQRMAAKMIVFGKGGFSLLTHLKFTWNVPWLKFEADAMRNLEKLKLRFNSLIEDDQGTRPIIIIERLSGLKEISAIIDSAGVDAGSAWWKAIRNDRGNPKVQLMGSIYYDDQGRETVTREGSAEDESNEADISVVHMERVSSSVPVQEIVAHWSEKESEDQPFMSEIICIPSESERTDGHVGQVFIEDSRELIRKTMRQTSEQFTGMSSQAALSRARENVDHRHIMAMRRRAENKQSSRYLYKMKVDEYKKPPDVKPQMNGLYEKDGTEPNAINAKYLEEILLADAASKRPEVVCIIGLPDRGKTVCATNVYEQIKGNFNYHLSVKVGKEPNMAQLIRNMIRQVKGTDESGDVDQLTQILSLFFEKKRYLVMLDDLWSPEDWRTIQSCFPQENPNSRIIITTRNEDAAKAAADHLYWIPVPVEASVEGLFSKEVPQWKDVEQMKQLIKVRYNGLSPDFRTCLLYLSIFPKKHVVEIERLVRLWLALGFGGPNGRFKEETARSCIKELIDRKLIEESSYEYDDTLRGCVVHPLIHEFIVCEATENQFLGLVLEEQRDVSPNYSKVRWLSVQNKSTKEAENYEATVRSINFFGQASGIHPLGNLTLLRVLDLEDYEGPVCLDGLLQLELLRYLSLRGTNVSELPEWIGYLIDLQTLDVRSTKVKKLPPSIVRLENLMHLLAGEAELPPGISKMKALVTLSCASTIESSTTASIKEIGKIARLKEFELLHGDTQSLEGNSLPSTHKNKGSDDEKQVVFLSNGFPSLEKLSIHCSFTSVIFETGALPKVKILELMFDKGVPEESAAVSIIQHLPSLERVIVKFSQGGADTTKTCYAVNAAAEDHSNKVLGVCIVRL